MFFSSFPEMLNPLWRDDLRCVSSCLSSFAFAARRASHPLVALGGTAFAAAPNVRTRPIVHPGIGRIQLVKATVIANVEDRDVAAFQQFKGRLDLFLVVKLRAPLFPESLEPGGIYEVAHEHAVNLVSQLIRFARIAAFVAEEKNFQPAVPEGREG